jgi:hypothetical protein
MYLIGALVGSALHSLGAPEIGPAGRFGVGLRDGYWKAWLRYTYED